MSLTVRNDNGLGEISIDVVFLRGSLQENLDSLYELVKDVKSQIQGNRLQIWLESPELIRLWNVPSNLLVSPYGDKIFIENDYLVFRKQNHTNYVFEQHYQIAIVCPKGQLSKASKLVENFRRKETSRGTVVVFPSEQSDRLAMHCYS